MPNKPILCVDFDGVIHSYTSGWKGADVVPDPPIAGALRWLWKASEWWDVQIYSSRTGQIGGVSGMKEWLRKYAMAEFFDANQEDQRQVLDWVEDHFLAAITFPEQKPAAMLTIDDRAITFEGVWADLDPCALLDFKPWNKRPLGATDNFPQGSLNEEDEGELKLGVAFDKIDGIVKLVFGKPVAWLGLPPAEAVQLGKMLMTSAGAKKIEVSF
jgi:hypothetical protein